MGLRALILPAAAAWLGLELTCGAFVLTGGSLPFGERHVRVFPNFSGPFLGSTAEQPSFPGASGAALAIWKAHVEWGSALHGDGSGDPSQPFDLGSGGADFDYVWQGLADGVGDVSSNTHSMIYGSTGGVTVFVETGPGGGWRVRWSSTAPWFDGVSGDVPVGALDLQGTATRVAGSLLGLGNSSVSGATMFPTLLSNGVSLRSIEADDAAGVMAIYGPASPTKPRIDAVTVAPDGIVTIDGENFAAVGNEVWWTPAGATPDAPPLASVGVPSTLGGTRLELTPPAAAGPGDVLVRSDAAATGASLSNAWPIDLAPAAPEVASVTPAVLDAVAVDGERLTVIGSALDAVHTVTLAGVPQSFQLLAPDTLEVEVEVAPILGTAALELLGAGGSATTTVTVVANATPALELLDSQPEVLDPLAGVSLLAGAEPGAAVLFLGATSGQPTSLPGVVELGIGAQASELWLLGTRTVSASSGKAQLGFPTPSSLPVGTNLWFQAAVLEPSAAVLPLVTTNVQVGLTP